jgi:prevent-host-death family protein
MEIAMAKRYSIAEARHNLAAIVHEAERAPAIELTRRGEPVAVLLSIAEYRRLAGKATNFWDAYLVFRNSADLSQLQIGPEVFEGIRDRSAGREVSW